jgi:outer membrane lipoprotein-sorting protein
MPFKWKFMWQSGMWEVELKDVQLNPPVEASRFARPSPPPAARAN